MHAPTMGRERAGALRKIVGGTPIFTESPSPFQAPLAPMPLRSRGAVPFNRFTPAALDRLAYAPLAIGQVALAEHPANAAADQRGSP
jgi:hypothetical protein